MKKRLLALIASLVMLLCLCACGETTPATTEPSGEATKPTTEATQPSTEAAEPTYVITVVDQDGAPVTGAWVQLCLESCVPAMTDENGVANFFLEEDDYKVSFTVMPVGYEYSGAEQEWYFASGETTMTVVLKSVG
jgi:hypothetical protein